MENIELHWSPLHPFKELEELRSPAKISGVYIWGYEIDGEFTLHYIGKAENIYGRIRQHLAFLRSGFFTLWNKDDLKKLPKKGDRVEKAIFAPPILDPKRGEQKKGYDKKWNYVTILKDYDNYKPFIDYMLETFRFSYARCDNKEKNDIERFLISKFKEDELENTRFWSPSKEYFIEHLSKDQRIRDLFSSRK